LDFNGARRSSVARHALVSAELIVGAQNVTAAHCCLPPKMTIKFFGALLSGVIALYGGASFLI
jgi:hypothetical protein